MCVRWIARESSPLFVLVGLLLWLGTNATSSGEDDTLSSNTLCMVCNLFALRLHSFLFETFALLRISRLHSLWLPAICVCLCSPLRCETYARSGLHNYASFYPNNSLAQRFWPHNTLDNTPRLYTSSSPRTPRQYALPLFCSRKNNFTKHLVLRQHVTEQCLTYSDMKFIIFQNRNTRSVGGSSQRVVKGNPLTIPINSSYQAIYIFKP